MGIITEFPPNPHSNGVAGKLKELMDGKPRGPCLLHRRFCLAVRSSASMTLRFKDEEAEAKVGLAAWARQPVASTPPVRTHFPRHQTPSTHSRRLQRTSAPALTASHVPPITHGHLSPPGVLQPQLRLMGSGGFKSHSQDPPCGTSLGMTGESLLCAAGIVRSLGQLSAAVKSHAKPR